MASKSAQYEAEKAEVIEEALDALDQLLDRVKVLYEQYFLGIQKQPPQHLHTDLERKLRDLAQLQIRNTALRYRFATVQQKFGAYNTYWRRTLREIEAGRYHRSLSRVTRRAAATGAEIPHEILAAMPQRMRDQVRRDREAAVALQRHRESAAAEAARRETVPQGAGEDDDDGSEGFVRESTEVRQRALRAREALHVIEEVDAEIDMDALLDAFVDEEPAVAAVTRPTAAAAVAAAAAAAAAAPPAAWPAPAAAWPAPAATAWPAPAAAAAAPPADPGAAERPKSGPSSSGRLPVPTPPIPAPSLPKLPPIAPSQQTRPTPIVPGAASATRPVTAAEMTGPFPRAPMGSPPRPPPPAPRATPPKPVPTVTIPPRATATSHPSGPRPAVPPGPRPAVPPEPRPAVPPEARPAIPPRAAATNHPSEPRPAVPPGMSASDVNALYDRYVEAKQQIGQAPNPGSFNKLMKTIHAQAPKIMEQYRAKAVDFSVAIKDNQVIIRAKPKL